MSPRHVTPVRRRLTVLGDGTMESCELVFCEAEHGSVRVSRCEGCPFAGPRSRETICNGVVDCALATLPISGSATDSRFPPDVAAALRVGVALARPVVCCEDSLPWIDGTRVSALRESSGAVPVVDRAGALLGILPAAAMASAGRGAIDDGVVSVADRAVSAVSVHERESLSSAFATMGSRRAREVTVVGDGHVVVGVLSDLDALHFVAHVVRTGMRPVARCAA